MGELVQAESVSANMQSIETPAKKRGRRPGQAKEAPHLRTSFPPIPVRGLWDAANEEERGQAKVLAVKIMETWLGMKSKIDVTRELNLRPIRFWQLSNQAMAGMLAGLLTQPRTRLKPKENGMTEREEINMLRKMVRELERKVMVQEKLIEILKTMPGCQAVEVKDDESMQEASGVSSSRKKASRSVVAKGPKGKSKGSGSST